MTVSEKSAWESFVACCIPDCCISECCISKTNAVEKTESVAKKSISSVSKSVSEQRTARTHRDTPPQPPLNADAAALKVGSEGSMSARAKAAVQSPLHQSPVQQTKQVVATIAVPTDTGAAGAKASARHKIYASTDLTSPLEFFAGEAARAEAEKKLNQPTHVTLSLNTTNDER